MQTIEKHDSRVLLHARMDQGIVDGEPFCTMRCNILSNQLKKSCAHSSS